MFAAFYLDKERGRFVTLYRIGEKVISEDKLHSAVELILKLRSEGKSQADVAKQVGVDRTFVSRLETLGEVRRGTKIALIGFPVGNKEEIQAVADEMGVDFTYLLTDKERWAFFQQKSGISLLDELMFLIGKARDHEILVLLGSDMRIKLAEALLDDTELIPVHIGNSPITEDKHVCPQLLRDTLTKIKKPSGG